MLRKEIAKQIIKESQESTFPEIIPRQLQVPLSLQKIIAITGPRRSGKTYFLWSLMQQLITQGKAREQFIFVNFDDPRLLPATAKDLEIILESYRELYPEHKDETNYIFFDEIQNVTDWEIGVRRIQDTRQFHVFLSGSSSKLLSKEISTHLRGRAIGYGLLPFSFKEILLARGLSLNKNSAYSSDRFSIGKHLETYLNVGGFPEVVLEEDFDVRIRTLKEYIETMFFKDLVERYRVKNQSLMRELIKYLTTNTASLFSLNAFYKWIKQTYPVTKRTLINYVASLEDIGLFFLVKKFSYSLKEQTQTPRKSYIIDNGFRTAYGFRFSEDRGKALENTVFLELLNQQAKNPLLDIFYWQDYGKKEVDFVVRYGKEVKQLIQVCAKMEDFKTKEREITGLVRASQDLKCKDLLVITEDEEKEEKFDKRTIVSKPLWKWLIEG